MEKLSQQESQETTAVESFKKKRISDLIYGTIPSLYNKLHTDGDRESIRKLDAFMEDFAGKYGPEADQSTTVEEMEEVFTAYMAIPGNEGIVTVETPGQLYEIQSESDTIPVTNIQKHIWGTIRYVHDEVHSLAERDGARRLADFIEKYAGKYGEDAEPIALHEAEAMYAEYAEIAGEHFQLPTVEEIKESDLYSKN